MGDSDIFCEIEAIPSVGFFGRSLTVNSTPNIGANNAKNGEITSLYNLENPLIKDLFNNQEIELKNVDNDYKFRLIDITGKENNQKFTDEEIVNTVDTIDVEIIGNNNNGDKVIEDTKDLNNINDTEGKSD